MTKQSQPEAPRDPGPLDPMQQLLAALNAVMKAVGYVQKDKQNSFHNYKYAGEESLLTALRPALVDNGLLLIPSLADSPRIDEYGNTHLTVAYTLAHVSGAVWPEKLVAAGCGNDKNKNGIGDKGTYKALTGANKYLLFKLFQIATGDDPEVESAHDRGEAPAKPAGVQAGKGTFSPTNGDDAPAQAGRATDMTVAALNEAYKAAIADIEASEGDDIDLVGDSIRRHAVTIEQIIRRKPMWWTFKDEPAKGMRNRIMAVITHSSIKPENQAKAKRIKDWLTKVEDEANPEVGRQEANNSEKELA